MLMLRNAYILILLLLAALPCRAQLLYGTYLGGGGGDSMDDMVRDSAGNIILCGFTQSSDFPTTPGAYQETLLFDCWAHVTKLSPNADSVIWATYIGRRASLSAVAADARGAVYCAGNFEPNVEPGDWPLTVDALDEMAEGDREGCFARLSPAGDSLEYSSYLGGGGGEQLTAIDMDNEGRLYLTGNSENGFPTTQNALFPNYAEPNFGSDGILAVFSPLTTSLVYSTYIPGNDFETCWDISVTEPGRLWVFGETRGTNFPVTPNAFQNELGNPYDSLTEDGFFMAWDINENRLLYSSYLGGESGDGCITGFYSIDQRLIYVTGNTSSENFPLSENVFDTTLTTAGGLDPSDAYIAVLDTSTGDYRASLLGGEGYDPPLAGVYVTNAGISIAGHTTSRDFPTSSDAIDSVFGLSGQPDFDRPDFFIAQLSLDLTGLLYGTFLGGAVGEQCFTSMLYGRDTLWVAGNTNSSDFPTTPDALQPNRAGGTDGILLKVLLPSGTPITGHPKPLLPDRFSLIAFPNPFNGSTEISLNLARAGSYELSIYDVLGRMIQHQEVRATTAGQHDIRLEFENKPSGIYFASLSNEAVLATTKLLYLK